MRRIGWEAFRSDRPAPARARSGGSGGAAHDEVSHYLGACSRTLSAGAGWPAPGVLWSAISGDAYPAVD